MRLVILTAALALSAAPTLSAQRPVTIRGRPSPTSEPLLIVDGVVIDNAPKPGPDPFAAYFFPPDLIMSHQRELGLQESQRGTILNELQQAQAKFLQLQWNMSAETERLGKLLQPPAVDEAQVLEQIDRVLAGEREIKRAQVALLIRIKNVLTPQQQAQLTALRKSQPG